MTTQLDTLRWIPDNSALAAFRESPELFRLKYRLHLQPAAPNDKMTAGSAIHAARNVLYTWRTAQRMPRTICDKPGCAYPACDCALSFAPLDTLTYPDDVIAEAVRVARAHRGEGEGARGAEQVEMVVRTYAAKYAVEPFAVVESERYAEARILCAMCAASPIGPTAWDADVNGGKGGYACECFDFCGIVDAAVRFTDASEYVTDLKSTGAYLNDAWETTARLGDQFVGYVAMRRANGARCDGFFVDGIHMKDARPKKDGSLSVPSVSEDDMVRVGPVSVPEWRIERWAADVRYTLRAIAELETTRGIDNPWPIYQNWPYGKVDAYREFYETPAELHSQVRAMFEVREWSPKQVADERAVAP